MSGTPLRWDVFCRVIDNYGDAAVCWRLARQLAAEHGLQVRLWSDDLGVLHRLNPHVRCQAHTQQVEGVEIRRWQDLDAADTCAYEAADVAIEAFGCGLPEACEQAMAQRRPSTLWVTLEYLSAEPWVSTHHGLPSPHPRLPLRRFYFFPGFESGTGGLLRERGLMRQREALQRDPAARRQFWDSLGFAPPPDGALTVSLFAYENPAAARLLEIWAAAGRPVVVAVPPSRVRPEVAAFCGVADDQSGTVLTKASLEVRFIPFLPQPRYDELLWLCDWNFVRGEDSFVRAQWAARPMTWHIYPQSGGAHSNKLNAFLDRYAEGLDPALGASLRDLWLSWNGGPPERLAGAWQTLALRQNSLEDHALAWASRLASLGDLAGNLVHFCRSKVE